MQMQERRERRGESHAEVSVKGDERAHGDKTFRWAEKRRGKREKPFHW